jgi:hypothetical protein
MDNKKIAVTFKGVRFQFELTSELADYVTQDMKLNGVEFDRDNDPRKLLTAYLKKSDEVFRLEKKLDEILHKIDVLHKTKE